MQEREVALTHVSIQDADLGWRHITPEEASKLFPNEPVSAGDRVFMCELCGQYVTLSTAEEKKTKTVKNAFNVHASIHHFNWAAICYHSELSGIRVDKVFPLLLASLMFMSSMRMHGL